MRRALVVAIASAYLLLSGLPVHAAGSGSIDHVETDGRAVKMLYSVPTQTLPDLDSIAVTAAGSVRRAGARFVSAGDVKRTVVLALDVSSSMRGERFAAAKHAALAYLRVAPADVRVGLVTFAGAVHMVAAPTTEHEQVQRAVGGLSLSDGTMLYRGILHSVAELGTAGQRDIVVLSDGADTSGSDLKVTVDDVRASGARVSVVALEQRPAARHRLAAITRASGGAVLPADDTRALTTLFSAQARALSRQVLVSFVSPPVNEGTVTVSMRARGVEFSDSTFVAFSPKASPTGGFSRPAPAATERAALDPLVLVLGAAALCAGLATVVVIAFGRARPGRTLVQRQLDYYSGQGGEPPRNGDTAGSTLVDARDMALSMASRVITKGDIESRLRTRLTAAGISLTPAEWLLMHAGVMVVAALVGLLLSGGSPLPLVLLPVLGAAGPWGYLRLKQSRRVKAFNAQLADTLQLISGGLSAGLSLPQAVDTVVRDGSEPMAGELQRALIEQRLGVEMEDALDGVGERMVSKDFTWVVMAIRIQREVGGNLAELLDTVSATLREREYLRRQVRSLSAEGRLSAWILGCLPPVFVLYLALVRGEYLEPMLTTPIGWALSGIAALMLAVAAFWLSKTVKVEV